MSVLRFRWADLREPCPSLPWETLESQFKFMLQLPLNYQDPSRKDHRAISMCS